MQDGQDRPEEQRPEVGGKGGKDKGGGEIVKISLAAFDGSRFGLP
jgi:hypothetical protein